ncbi:cytochrome c [Rhodoblastus acidophilus]|uniref:Cytochrome c n=1 Tax=Rhodoblastus acidophilus TaxID=1074 RepID=A0A212RX30_RHOAC|nr:cytochrome c family protein [Rhodoblastus acidophilus]MCW2315218.1 cytochrome c [Rhodoblastus acidophilus]PPQ38398.1 cytochrome c family protein [Rhodoblastus acidophilus]RAI17067.1 cytochrome c family protein [Rhodoblastus acidophilus]SNB77216.1 cytochrome c [Rhodoblastus acidophilus]
MNGKSLVLSAALLCGFSFGALAQEAGDPAAGEKVFRVCRQCHHIGRGATNFYGPVLNGLIDRPAGSVPGYNYSEANKTSGKVWNVPTLTSYLRQPQHDVPKTYMTFAGIKSDKEIADVIAYIAQYDRSGAKKGEGPQPQ